MYQTLCYVLTRIFKKTQIFTVMSSNKRQTCKLQIYIRVFIWGLRDCNPGDGIPPKLKTRSGRTKEVRVFTEEKEDLHKLF